jgi:aconitate hydratase
MSIYDGSVKYQADGVPLMIIAGKEYGSGSSRDWAAKGVLLLGVRAVIAESFERIHRTNLVGMGVLPLQFRGDETAASLGLTGRETFSVEGIRASLNGGGRTATVHARADDGKETKFTVDVRVDTPQEVEYYRYGGILPYVLQQLAAGAVA